MRVDDRHDALMLRIPSQRRKTGRIDGMDVDSHGRRPRSEVAHPRIATRRIDVNGCNRIRMLAQPRNHGVKSNQRAGRGHGMVRIESLGDRGHSSFRRPSAV